MSAGVAPEEYSGPNEPLVITYSVYWYPACEYEDYPWTYFAGVEVSRAGQLVGWGFYDWGELVDTGPKDQYGAIYSLVFHFYCGDEWGPDFYREFTMETEVSADAITTLDHMRYDGETLVGTPWWNMADPLQYCWLTNETGGFHYEYWRQRFVAYNQWNDYYWESFSVWEDTYIEYLVEPCESEP